MMNPRLFVTVIAVVLTCAGYAGDRETLLKTEQEYVAELLAMGQPKLAQQHLDIIQREFPKQVETIHFYQGQISFATKDYKTAAHNFTSVLKQKPAALRKQIVIRRLVESYTHLSDSKQALPLLKQLKPTSGKGAWYPEAIRAFAEALHQDLAKKPARSRVKEKDEAIKLIASFAKEFPKDPVMPWMQFYLAEFEYDRLIALLYDKGKITSEGSPVTIERKDDAMAVQVHRTRGLFKSIKASHAKHPVIKRVDPRLKFLNPLIDKMSGQ